MLPVECLPLSPNRNKTLLLNWSYSRWKTDSWWRFSLSKLYGVGRVFMISRTPGRDGEAPPPLFEYTLVLLLGEEDGASCW